MASVPGVEEGFLFVEPGYDGGVDEIWDRNGFVGGGGDALEFVAAAGVEEV